MISGKYYWGICFVTSLSDMDSPIFGFAQFISALALLFVIYTVTDVRYRFRLAIAPIPLFLLTFVLTGIIGLGTLLTDIWFRKHWLVPKFLNSQSMLQGILGASFLLLVMTWIFYAFIRPPIFGKRNGRRFCQELYRLMLKGSDTELPVIAYELARSAKSLVGLCRENLLRDELTPTRKRRRKKQKPDIGDYAHDMLLLIGNRKLCRHIVAASPVTAMAFFEAMTAEKKYAIPIGQFARNISAEAIINKDSILYHEDEGYDSGLIGYLKPFSQSIYGNYKLLDMLGLGSPLDIDYKARWSWDASQVEAYCRAVMITLKNYLESHSWSQQFPVLSRALENIKDCCNDVYKLNDIPSDIYSTDIYKRLTGVVDFFKESTNVIGQQEPLPSTHLRVRGKWAFRDLYDHIAMLMFKIIFSAAWVTEPPDKCWAIHYNAVWGDFFTPFGEGKAWKIVQFKLRRMLYDEIIELETFPNYKSAKILGICLNVMGMKTGPKKLYGREDYALRRAVLAWTKNNYLRLKDIQPDVARSCLIGSISFDVKGARLIKTYMKGLNLEAPKEYLELNPTNDVPNAGKGTEEEGLFSTA